MKQTDEAVSFISNILKGIFGGNYKDVPMVHLYRHYTESVLISLLNAKRLRLSENDNLAVLNKMAELHLLSSEVSLFYSEHRSLIESEPQLDMSADWSNAHSIHEGLLSREFYISEKNILFSAGKVSRDKTGSYYTPGNLALEVVREAINQYMNTNGIRKGTDAVQLLAETKFADLSCGCGEFIKAIRTELSEQYNIKPEKICRNLYGIDIDPIALQITVCDLLEKSSLNSWREIISHFVLGNPLIDQRKEKDNAIKTCLFATSRYYNSDMGIDINRLFAGTRIDIVVGNPPWEKVRFEERKFFMPISPEISAISQKNKRQAAIENLKYQSPLCHKWYRDVAEDYINFRKKTKNHPFLDKSMNGERNTYALFTELSLNIIGENGALALLTKSTIATSPANKPLFTHMVEQKNVASICLFSNTLRIFDIDSREQFCAIACTKKANPSFELVAGATEVDELHSKVRSSLTWDEIKVINPYTQMLPNISRNEDVQVLLSAHRRLPLFDAVYPECHYGRLVHLTLHADYIDTASTAGNEPIYEGKFIERYDARFATFAGLSDTKKYSAKAHAKKNVLADGAKPLPESRYFIQREFWERISANYTEQHMLCWRSLTSPTNARTTLAMLLPKMPTCQSIQFLQTENRTDLMMMLALLNSKPFDFLVRLKMPGIDLTQSVIRQIPVPSRDTYKRIVEFSNTAFPLERHILERVTVILSREPMLLALLKDLEPPTMKVQKKSNTTLEKELDDLFFIAYGFSDFECQDIQRAFKK